MSLLDQVKILVVDDDQDTRDLLRFMLEDYGAIVTVVSSAKEALTTLDAATPDVLISDVAMPQMDGYSLIEQIRQRPSGEQLPAIALTAYARQEDRDQAIQAGFNDHLAKPVDPLELMKLIQQYC